MNTLHPSEVFSWVCNPDPYQFKVLSILPRVYVENIDDEIKREVIPFVRKFESLSLSIQTEAISVARVSSLGDYYNELSVAWAEHNRLAQIIDGFLSTSIVNGQLCINRGNIIQISKLLLSALRIERRKRILSAGVKHVLDASIEPLRIRTNLSVDQMQKVLTVQTPNYWILHHARHIEFRLKSRTKEASGLKRFLCIDFHAGNQFVMEGRLRQELNSRLYSKNLEDTFRRYQEIGRKMRETALEGEYLALGNPNLQALRSIITYDNFVEYSFGHNLFGIPDLLLRKFVISSLIDQGYLEKRGALLLYSDEELLGALKQYEN